MSLDPESARRLRELFAAITAEVERAKGGEVVAEVQCGPNGGVIRWKVQPAWIKSAPIESGGLTQTRQ